MNPGNRSGPIAAVPHAVQLRRVKGWRLPPNTKSAARPLSKAAGRLWSKLLPDEQRASTWPEELRKSGCDSAR